MKVLILSAQPPSPYSGGEIRLLNLIKHLSDQHEFTIVAPVQKLDNPSVIFARKIGQFYPIIIPPNRRPKQSRIIHIARAWMNLLIFQKPGLAEQFYNPIIKTEIQRTLNQAQYDLIQVQQLTMAQYLPNHLAAATVLDMDNLWSTLVPRLNHKNQETKFTRRIQTQLERNNIRKYERKMIRRFDMCLAISAEDKQIITSFNPKRAVAIIPNGVDVEEFTPQTVPQVDQRTILFTGTMSWLPNSEAALFFATQILPLIWQKFPEIKFFIVGRNPSPEIQALTRDKRIEVTGFVEDVKPYYSRADVFVAPLKAGAGTRLKILEALAMAKPVVSTAIGAEGLLTIHGEHLLIANEAEDFAQHVCDLFEDPLLSRTLGVKGRKLVEEHYDWKVISHKLGEIYDNLC